MIQPKEIVNNPQRYKSDGEKWSVSAIADSPNSNSTKEIKPLSFDFGKVLPSDSLKGVLVTDGIVVLLSSGELLCSPNTLKSIKEFGNPHWDITSNGTIKVKDKEVTLGKSIPVIRLDINNLTQSALSMKKADAIAGVESVEWIFEGEKLEGIPLNLINQIDWTLTDGIDKVGDSFKIWDWKLSPDSVYSIEPIIVSTTQEDGKFDKVKLDTFLKEINSRINALNSDFAAIKGTFYNGKTPPNSGVQKFSNVVAQTIDDSHSNDTFITEGPTTIVSVDTTPKDKVANSSQKAVSDLATKTAETINVETSTLKATQKSLEQKIQEAGSVTNYVTQAGGWDKFIKEMYDKQSTK